MATMHEITRPLFIIPKENRNSKSKRGGGSMPVSIISKNDLFEEHKKSRKREVTSLIDSVALINQLLPILTSENSEQVYFEISINEKKLSKTDQNYVKDFLRTDSIDLISHITENRFVASSEIQKLKNFKETVDNLEFQATTKSKQSDSNVFSYIERIDFLKQSDLLVNEQVINSKDDFIGYIFLHSNISVTEIEGIFKRINALNNAEHTTKLITTSFHKNVIYGHFKRDFINQISVPSIRNPIRKIEPDLEFILKQNLRISKDFKNIKIIPPVLNNIVGVVDSGIVVTHPLLKELVVAHESFIGEGEERNPHGTFVASRIVFGNDLEDLLEDGVINASAKVLDIAVLGNKTRGQNIIEALEKCVKVYPDIKVYNLSLGSPDEAINVYNGIKSTFTRELDSLAKKYGVLFVVSAGNQDSFWDKKSSFFNQYPECILKNPSSTIIPPADAVNVITVGSIADIESTKSIARKNEPSPFTRAGRVGGQLKPELCHYGGNVDKYGNEAGIGVKGLSDDGSSLQEGVGTSYAAPLISQIASQISSYLDLNQIAVLNNNILLTKALLIHSAKEPQLDKSTTIPIDEKLRIFGYGIPSFDTAVDSIEQKATFIFQDELSLQKGKDDQRANIHEIYFDIPDELKNQKRKIRLKATLAYTPPVSEESNDNDYYESRIEMTCHHLNSKNKLNNRTRKTPSNWAPVKQELFEFKPTQYSNGKWKVVLTLTAQGQSDNEDFVQPYALVISIEDITDDNRPKTNIYDIIKTKYPIYQSVRAELNTKIKVQSK